MTGAVVSTTVTVCVQAVALPQSSVAIQTRVMISSCGQLPAARLSFSVIAGSVSQLSVAVATPVAARWLLNLGENYTAQLTLRSAFQFESWIILGMGVIFELPILIFFLARIGVVTPGWLMKNFRYAVLGIALLSAVLTPTGDMITMSVFAGPMILLYLLGVAVAWVSQRRRGA